MDFRGYEVVFLLFFFIVGVVFISILIMKVKGEGNV